MSSFTSKLFSLISNNEALFEFINTYAQDGCWIMEGTHDQEVYIDKKLSTILGVDSPTVSINEIFTELSANDSFDLYNESPAKAHGVSHTVKVFKKNGLNLFQRIKYFVVSDESGTKYLIGGHQNIIIEHHWAEEPDKFNNIIKGTGLGTWEWNVQTGECVFNERWAEIIGYELAELQPVSIQTWEKYAHPEDLEGSGLALKEHFKGNTSTYEFESRMQHKEGYWVWVLTRGKVVTWTDNGESEWMVGSHQDITQRKRQELELSKYRDLLEQSTKLANIGIWEILLDENQIYWGEVTKSIHEVPKDFIPEYEKAIAFFPEGYNRDTILEHFNLAVEENIPYDIELQIKTLKGNLRWVRAIGLPEFLNGKCIRVFGLFQDIDKTKIASLRNDKLIESTQEQNNRLLNFAHIVSHNLRSHSNNFSMLSGMLGKDITADRKQRVFDLLLSASEKLKDTITHLDEVVNINLSLQENFTNLPLNKFVESTVNSLSTLAEIKNFEIKLSLDGEYIVFGVSAYLESLTLNFLSNAIKYADPEKQKNYVIIKAERVADEVLLHFEDNGLGINLKKHGDKLFGMYKTFHSNIDARGIGLFITRNQVEAMGGKISVNSKVGIGTTFTVHLRAKVD